jgi:glutamyl-tRNA(Gln) amidotransferase subunit D
MAGALKPGEKVEIRLGGKVYVGQVMARPELAEEGYFTLKLASGYDIGVRESEVESVSVLSPAIPKKAPQPKPASRDKSKPLVSIISTGGTIASKVDYASGGVSAAFTAADLLESMPELAGMADIKAESVMNVMSEDMNPKLWARLAEAICKELRGGADGVVVTHGTDTMHFSTAAMSFMLRGLGRPVVFTGSQRSTDRGSADSYMNLLCSVAYAKSPHAGVFLVMHGSISDDYCFAHRGTKVRKLHNTRRDAFQSVNIPPAAKIFTDGRIEDAMGGASCRTDSEVTVDSNLEERVALVKVYPGMDPGIIDYHIGRGIRGMVIEGTGLGHIPTNIKEYSLVPRIEDMVKKGVLVAMTTQCIFGRVNPYVYSNLREVSSRGVVYCEDMLSETAYAKMMWVLGKAGGLEEAKKLMLQNIAGEFSERTTPAQKFICL